MIVTRVTVTPMSSASQRRNDAFREQAARVTPARADDRRQRDDGRRRAAPNEPGYELDVTV
jgi:hypothetical protein